MLTTQELLTQASLLITDHTVSDKWQVGDPATVQQLQSLANFISLLSKDIEIASAEAFNKTNPRSIIADATNKGILPLSIPHRHTIEITNKSDNRVTLSQGRLLEDNSGGRTWQLLSAVTIEANSTNTVIAEQSEQRQVSYTVPLTEIFHRFQVQLQDDKNLASISISDTLLQSNTYAYKNKWLNVLPDELAYNIISDERQRLFVEFGADGKAGRTAQAGEVYTITILETEGSIDVSKLNDASLEQTFSNDEQKLVLKFKSSGVIQSGTSPYSIQELKMLTNYASIYDSSAVYLGDFDLAIRRMFLARTFYCCVWNENIQEQYYSVDISDINHLHVCFVPKNPEEYEQIKEQMALAIALQDNLYKGRTKFTVVEEIPHKIKLKGNISSLHDVDSVTAQIKALLVANYGKTTLTAHKWLVNGFNNQAIARLIRSNISAFQDNISDFSLSTDQVTYKPHQWTYISDDSIEVDLERTAESSGSIWLNT